jgi:hypothetical protein
MKKTFTLIFSIYLFTWAQAQPGTWQWATTGLQPARNAYALSACVATDQSGNVFCAGNYANHTITFGGITLRNTAPGMEQIDLVKYDGNGNVLWAVAGRGGLNQWPSGIATDKSGNVYLVGQFQSPMLIFGQDTLFQTANSLQSYVPVNDGFVVKYSASGHLLWARKFGGNYWDGISSVVIDNANNIYLSAWYRSDSVVFDGITLYDQTHQLLDNTALIKCDSSGNLVWVRNSAWGYGAAVGVDPAGNVIMTGGFWGHDSIVFGTHSVVSLTNGNGDFFIAKFDAAGNALWAKNTGVLGTYANLAAAISVDSRGSIYLTGNFTADSVTLGNYTFHGDAFQDSYYFIEKYDSAGNVSWARGAAGKASGTGVATDPHGNTYVTGDFYRPAIGLGRYVLYNPDSATSSNHIFVAKYDANGNVLSSMAVGGDSADISNWIALDTTGNLYLAGAFYSDSIGFGNNELFNAGYNSSSPFLAKFNSAPLVLTINAFPSVSVCGGDTVDICATAGYSAYLWNNGDTGRCIQTTNAGEYFVIAYEGDSQLVSNHLSISTSQIEPISLSVYGDSMICYSSGKYQWYFDGNPLAGDTFSALVANQNGNYQVMITDTNGCSFISRNIPYNLSAVQKTVSDNIIEIFPNPSANGDWTLFAGNIQPGSLAQIYDCQGNLVSSTEITNELTRFHLVVPGGVYILKVMVRNEIIVRRLVKL